VRECDSVSGGHIIKSDHEAVFFGYLLATVHTCLAIPAQVGVGTLGNKPRIIPERSSLEWNTTLTVERILMPAAHPRSRASACLGAPLCHSLSVNITRLAPFIRIAISCEVSMVRTACCHDLLDLDIRAMCLRETCGCNASHLFRCRVEEAFELRRGSAENAPTQRQRVPSNDVSARRISAPQSQSQSRR
jgi:hypothetical protein